jgi:hypothetical protein
MAVDGDPQPTNEICDERYEENTLERKKFLNAP